MKLVIALHHPFVLWRAPSWLAEKLAIDFPQITVYPTTSYDDLTSGIVDADAAILWSIRPDQLAGATRLRWIHSPAAAVHQLMYPELVNNSVVVTNAREVHGFVVAEHAMALLFALGKRLPSAMRYQQKKIWAQQQIFDEQPGPCEIADATIVLFGMGSIGREFTKRAKALGAKVVAVREHPERGADGADRVLSNLDIDKVLPQADFVVLAAPVTPQTRHVINENTLALMRRDAYLINVSRGPLIDDLALADSLRSGGIAGAALDVFAEEPLPPDSPYWDMENVLMTPHTAAVTEKLWPRQYQLIEENLRRFLAGDPLRSVVDKHKGY